MSSHRPTFDDFTRLAGKARCVPVYRQLTSDGLTPVSAFARIERNAPSFLFESVIGGEKVGRYSFLGTEPFLSFEARGNDIVVTTPGKPEANRSHPLTDPFAELQQLVELHHAVHLPGLPRFAGGAVGYAADHAVRYTEHLTNPPRDHCGSPRPVAFVFRSGWSGPTTFARPPWSWPAGSRWSGIPPAKGLCVGCALVYGPPSGSPRPGPESHCLIWTPRVLLAPCHRPTFRERPISSLCGTARDTSRPATSFSSCPASGSASDPARPLNMYRALGVINPIPFLFFLKPRQFPPDRQFAGNPGASRMGSTIRPLAGTRRRGRYEAEDLPWRRNCWPIPRNGPNIHAGRSGRNASAGWPSWQRPVVRMMKVERYSHVMHITSNVRASSKGKTALDALRAACPPAPFRVTQGEGHGDHRRMKPTRRTLRRSRRLHRLHGNMDPASPCEPGDSGRDGLYSGRRRRFRQRSRHRYEETLNKARGLLNAIEIAETQL